MATENTLEIDIRRQIINSLIPTASYASLQPSAKDLILDTADMLVDYIIQGRPAKKQDKPVKDKRKRAPTK